jgi:tRNA threonylcarbamoyladenosine biosynthesis protein TsaE
VTCSTTSGGWSIPSAIVAEDVVVQCTLEDEAATRHLGEWLADALGTVPGRQRLLVGLSGDLGAGKSTLARAMLRRLGVTGTIRSPTYTLAEPYTLADGSAACHLDLYRLADAEELEFLGFRDMLESCRLILVEWPERASALAEHLDLDIELSPTSDGRTATLRVRTAGWIDVFQRLPRAAGEPR